MNAVTKQQMLDVHSGCIVIAKHHFLQHRLYCAPKQLNNARIDMSRSRNNVLVTPPAKIAKSPTDAAARFVRAALSSAVDHEPRGGTANAEMIAELNTDIAIMASNGRDIVNDVAQDRNLQVTTHANLIRWRCDDKDCT